MEPMIPIKNPPTTAPLRFPMPPSTAAVKAKSPCVKPTLKTVMPLKSRT
jgi:hypothetical protein